MYLKGKRLEEDDLKRKYFRPKGLIVGLDMQSYKMAARILTINNFLILVRENKLPRA